LITLTRTLISDNTGTIGGPLSTSEVLNNYGSVTAASFNLFGHRELTNAQALSGFTPSTTDTTAISDGNTPTALAKMLDTRHANNGGLPERMPWWLAVPRLMR
jgi:hypothetical protein